jgi:hypothetical protein
VDIATKWAEELVRARIGDDGLSALKAHIGVFSCPLPSPLFFSRVSRVSVFEGFIDDSYSLGGGGVVSGAFMAMGHTGPHVDSSDVKGGITIAIPLSVCFHTPSFPHFSSSHVCLACVQGGTAQLCVHQHHLSGAAGPEQQLTGLGLGFAAASLTTTMALHTRGYTLPHVQTGLSDGTAVPADSSIWSFAASSTKPAGSGGFQL